MTLHLVHMTRTDPLAAGATQIWRGWVQTPTATGIPGRVITEVGELGGNVRRVEVGEQVLAGQDANAYLESEMNRLLADGWTVRFESLEPLDEAGQRRYYQFKVAGDDVAVLQILVGAFRHMEGGPVDWIEPQVLPHLDLETVPSKWECPIQIGANRVLLKRGGRNKCVLNAQVPVGSVADQVLAVLANNNIGMSVVVADSNAVAEVPSTLFHSGSMPGWLTDFAYEVGAAVRPLCLAPGPIECPIF